MKKLILSLIICLLFLTSCSQTKPEKEIDIMELGDQLMEKYADLDISQVSEDNLEFIVGELDYLQANTYFNLGISANQLLILKVNDSKKTIEQLEDYLQRLKKDYSSYLPEEVVKLDNPLIYTSNNVVILVISDINDEIASYLDQYFNEE